MTLLFIICTILGALLMSYAEYCRGYKAGYKHGEQHGEDRMRRLYEPFNRLRP